MYDDTAMESIRILLIDGEPDGAGRLVNLLESAEVEAASAPSFSVTWVDSAEKAFRLLRGRRAFDVVLFDFAHAGEARLTVLVHLQEAATQMPVVVLGDDDGPDALAAIRQGVQDWIPESQLTPSLLLRTIRHAMVRKEIDVELRRQLQRVQKARSRTRRETAELRARAKQLDAANRELDDFVYVVSHDLKEPLRGIRAYCEILLEDFEEQIDREGTDRLRAMTAMCDRLETQIGDLLTYYRVGRENPAVARVDLAAVVDGQVAALRPFLDRRNGEVRVKGALPTVHGHPMLLGMVLGNLIGNGLKYNRSRRPTVEIGAVDMDRSTIYVRDNGIGIAREHHEAIFAMFRRLHGRKEYEGSGAGLAIVRKIVEGYGGRIWVESEPGSGSTFFFSLPRAAGEPTRPPHWRRGRTGPAGATTRRRAGSGRGPCAVDRGP